MVDDRAKIPDALQQIDALADKLGMTINQFLCLKKDTYFVINSCEDCNKFWLTLYPLSVLYAGFQNKRIAGKIEAYLHQKNPALFKKLYDAHVFVVEMPVAL